MCVKRWQTKLKRNKKSTRIDIPNKDSLVEFFLSLFMQTIFRSRIKHVNRKCDKGYIILFHPKKNYNKQDRKINKKKQIFTLQAIFIYKYINSPLLLSTLFNHHPRTSTLFQKYIVYYLSLNIAYTWAKRQASPRSHSPRLKA